MLFKILLFGVSAAFNLINCRITSSPYTYNLPPLYVPVLKSVKDHFNSFSKMTNQRIILLTSECDLCNTITVDNRTVSGSTSITGSYRASMNEWVCEPVNIRISPRLTFRNVIFNVLLHELLHSKGLFHSSDPRSVMNSTLIVDKNGIPKNTVKKRMTSDDLRGLSIY
jgi:hypothetical protein